jgi:enolase
LFAAVQVPAFNVINGGSHAGNALAMQEFMLLPTGAHSFREAMQMGSEIYHTLKGVIKGRYGQDACNVGDEGGFAPNIRDSMEALALCAAAIDQAGYTGKVKIGMDVAASEFYTHDGHYDLDFKSSEPNPELKVRYIFFFSYNNYFNSIIIVFFRFVKFEILSFFFLFIKIF